MKKYNLVNKERPIIVIGAGGHSKVIIDTLLLNKKKIIGILDNDKKLIGKKILGVSVLGDDSYIEKYRPNEVFLVNAVASIKTLVLRKKIYDFFVNRGFSFTKVIHEKAVVSPFAKLSEDAQVFAGAVVQPGCVVGINSIINTRASIDHDTVIGEHCHIAPGCVLSGFVTVGNYTHIGTSSVVIQSINIGKSVLIGAGAVVLKDVKDNTRVVNVFKG